MKFLEMQKCPMCGTTRCKHSGEDHDEVCGICHQYPCDCNEEQEEIEYNGKKIKVGKHKDEGDTRFDPHELRMGMEHELKFTGDNKRAAKAIAKDHLIQMPTYYSDLMKHSFKAFNEAKNYDWENEDVKDELKRLYRNQASACHELYMAVKVAAERHKDDVAVNYCMHNYNWRALPNMVAHRLPVGNTLGAVVDMYPMVKKCWRRVDTAKHAFQAKGGKYDK